MIRYTLHCDREHEFEAWFRSAGDYDRAAKAGSNVCPVCGSAEVRKAIMAPALGGTKKGEKVSLAVPDPRSQAMRELVREFRKKVTENADYVGDKFAEEARKIHYGESDKRGIYGQTSEEEAEALAEEGIEFGRLPWIPRGN